MNRNTDFFFFLFCLPGTTDANWGKSSRHRIDSELKKNKRRDGIVNCSFLQMHFMWSRGCGSNTDPCVSRCASIDWLCSLWRRQIVFEGGFSQCSSRIHWTPLRDGFHLPPFIYFLKTPQQAGDQIMISALITATMCRAQTTRSLRRHSVQWKLKSRKKKGLFTFFSRWMKPSFGDSIQYKRTLICELFWGLWELEISGGNQCKTIYHGMDSHSVRHRCSCGWIRHLLSANVCSSVTPWCWDKLSQPPSSRVFSQVVRWLWFFFFSGCSINIPC